MDERPPSVDTDQPAASPETSEAGVLTYVAHLPARGSATSQLARTDGAADLVAGAGTPVASSYVQYLPSIYQVDPFVGRFLLIFESILAPIERMIDTVADCLDPRSAPEELLPWLASWVGIDLDETWTLAQRREVIAKAVLLYRWRGTRRGLSEYLRIYTRRDPLIVENFTGLRLGRDAALGVNTRLGEPAPHCIAVTVLADDPETLDERILRRIVEATKPAHVGYTLEVRAMPAANVLEAGP